MLLAIKRRKPTRTRKPPVLTWAQICKKYPSRWVLIAEPRMNKSKEVKGGRVVAYGEDRDETCRMITKLNLQSGAILFTGQVRNEKNAFLL